MINPNGDKATRQNGDKNLSPRRHFAPSPRRSQGFTLLELILAMFVTCLLAAALYGSLWTAFKARDAAEAAVGPIRDLQVAMAMVGKDLQCAVPMTSNSNNQTSMIGPFEGQPQGTLSQLSDTVEFYAIINGVDSNDPTQADGLKRIDLEMTTLSDGTPALVENIAPALPGDQTLITNQQQGQAAPVPRVICRNVASFTVQYYDGQNWDPSWDATAYTSDNLPMAVQVTIQLKPTPGSRNQTGMTMTRSFALPAAIPITSSSGTS